jgi:hypothetical protein
MSVAWDDDALLGEALAAIRENLGPAPAHLVAAGKQIYTWRSVDAELAVLTFDSLLDEPVGAVRGGADMPRVLTFEAAGVTVELEVEHPPTGRRLSGQLVPPGAADVEARAGEALWRGVADRFGRFVLPLPSRPSHVDLRFTRSGGQPVTLLTFL